MKKLLTLLLAAALVITAAGCGRNNDNSSPAAPAQNANGVTTLYDFESWQELGEFLYLYDFGTATVNTDKRYIKSGDGSMKVEIKPTELTPFILFYPGFEPNEKYDFGDVDRIMLDVYNAEEREVSIWLNLDTRSSYGFEMNSTGKEFVLKPASWTKVVYELDREALTKAFSLEEVMHIALRFQATDENYCLYLDNLQIRTGQPQAEYNVSREANELLFFEDDRDINFFNCTTYYFRKCLFPIVDNNYDARYCSQGRKSMRVRVPLSPGGYYPMIDLQTEALGEDVFRGAEGISIDIYNANGKQLPVDFHFRDFHRTSGAEPKGKLKKTVYLDPGEWTTVTVTKAELAAATVNIEAIQNIGFEFIDQSDSDFAPFIVYYLDNFTIIK